MKIALVLLLVGTISAATLPEQPLRLPLPKEVQQRMPWLVDEPINMSEMARGEPDTKVVGGDDAPVGFAPFQIALERSNSFTCGGSLISSQTVLTAAHCVYGNEGNPTSFRIRYGSNIRNGGTIITVSKVIRHPSYSSNTIDYDIALLVLANEFTPSANAKVIGLASANPATGSTCSLTGWGRLSSGGNLPTNLQKATLTTITKEDCQKRWGSVNTITDRMLCAFNAKQSACNVSYYHYLVISCPSNFSPYLIPRVTPVVLSPSITYKWALSRGALLRVFMPPTRTCTPVWPTSKLGSTPKLNKIALLSSVVLRLKNKFVLFK